jgi:hypothetical protein
VCLGLQTGINGRTYFEFEFATQDCRDHDLIQKVEKVGPCNPGELSSETQHFRKQHRVRRTTTRIQTIPDRKLHVHDLHFICCSVLRSQEHDPKTKNEKRSWPYYHHGRFD